MENEFTRYQILLFPDKAVEIIEIEKTREIF